MLLRDTTGRVYIPKVKCSLSWLWFIAYLHTYIMSEPSHCRQWWDEANLLPKTHDVKHLLLKLWKCFINAAHLSLTVTCYCSLAVTASHSYPWIWFKGDLTVCTHCNVKSPLLQLCTAVTQKQPRFPSVGHPGPRPLPQLMSCQG